MKFNAKNPGDELPLLYLKQWWGPLRIRIHFRPDPVPDPAPYPDSTGTYQESIQTSKFLSHQSYFFIFTWKCVKYFFLVYTTLHSVSNDRIRIRIRWKFSGHGSATLSRVPTGTTLIWMLCRYDMYMFVIPFVGRADRLLSISLPTGWTDCPLGQPKHNIK